jgi:cytochrome d ubiquinol oxidase subunit I
VLFSLILFTLVYLILLSLFLYLLNKKIQHGFDEVHLAEDPEHSLRNNPLMS